MSIQESNKLIAKFMKFNYKWKLVKFKGGNQYKYYSHPKRLKYHSSWDWLMLVVEKIESLDYLTRIETRFTQIYQATGKEYDYIQNQQGKTKLEATYKAVVEFIKQYNKNKG